MKLDGLIVLLTGGSGTLGKEIIPLLKAKGARVLAPSHKEFPVEDILVVNEYARENRFDIIFHAAAWTDVPGAEKKKNYQKVIDCNINGTSHMKYIADTHGAKLIYISTDYVYNGVGGCYDVKSPTKPTTFYGFSKLAGESYVDVKTDIIIRTTFAKRGTWGPSGKQLNAVFEDVYTSKDWVDIIAEKIVQLISKRKKGLFNVGTERKSIVELAEYEYPEVRKILASDVNLGYEYPMDTSMISSI